MRKISLLLLTIAMVGCAATEPSPEPAPLYKQAAKPVGYMGKFQYWQPAKKQSALSAKAKAVRTRLTQDGAVVLIYQYDIDSNGMVRNVALVEVSPAGSATTDDLIASNLIYPSWKAGADNAEQVPVTVTERVVLLKEGVAIPPDDMPINEFLKTLTQPKSS